MLSIGLMSGTSLDGVDVCLVSIENDKFKLKDYLLYPYDEEFKKILKRNLSDDSAKLSEICSLNFELPIKFKEAIDILLNKNNLTYKDIEFISSHGQTIWHNPRGLNGLTPSTLQIGSGQVLSALTQTKVVSNFRVSDVVVSGEGAPLVPMFDYIYFKDPTKDIVLQNLGGMGNLTYIRKDACEDDLIAFDTGPGNVMIDYFMNVYYNKPYDENGKTALQGKIIKELYDKLISDEYFYLDIPKSTGREKYSFSNLEKMRKDYLFDSYKKEDVITTITEITVFSMIHHYNNYLKNIDKIIISGGGVHNSYIMNRLKEEYPNKVFTLEEVGLNSDAKEAMAFVVLGYLTLNNKHANVIKATGAKKRIILGDVNYNMEV